MPSRTSLCICEEAVGRQGDIIVLSLQLSAGTPSVQVYEPAMECVCDAVRRAGLPKLLRGCMGHCKVDSGHFGWCFAEEAAHGLLQALQANDNTAPWVCNAPAPSRSAFALPSRLLCLVCIHPIMNTR